jgi:protein-tyrosine sulfotransferase
MTGRTGTNYLAHLLRLHPDCQGSYEIPEDFLVFKSTKLFDFARSCAKQWAFWNIEPRYEEHLLRCLGLGLVEFLIQEIGALRPVTKTPSVRNLRLFFRLFPEACLIVLLRDPRAVATSMVRGLGTSYTDGLEAWALAADEIMAFEGLTSCEGHRYMVVRYEALVSNLRDELTRLLEFAGLDLERYDFDLAANAPVIGSSRLLDEEGKVSWRPVQKPDEFSPLQRATTWSRAHEARLAWLSGRQAKALGYPPTHTGRGVWSIYNICCDGFHALRKKWRLIKDRSRRVAERRQRSVSQGKEG